MTKEKPFFSVLNTNCHQELDDRLELLTAGFRVLDSLIPDGNWYDGIVALPHAKIPSPIAQFLPAIGISGRKYFQGVSLTIWKKNALMA